MVERRSPVAASLQPRYCRGRLRLPAPATASGVVLLTLEDEIGVSPLIDRPPVFEAHRRAARHSTAVAATGTVERAGAVVHVLVKTLERLDDRLMALASQSRDFR